MNLTNALDPFVSPFYCLRGFGFKAQPLAVPIEESATYFNLPRRILKLYPDAKLLPGDTIRDETTKKMYFAGENGPSLFAGRVIHKTMKLFEITHPNATLESRVQLTDTVTGLKKNLEFQESTIKAVIEFTKMQEDEMRVGADLVRVITAVPIKPNDRVNGYTIVNSESQLGLYFSTARKMG